MSQAINRDQHQARSHLRGSLFMVVAPSGAGKSTLVNAVLSRDTALKLSVSCTTRPPRMGEMNGREYHFLHVEDFLARKARGDFLEWAEIYGNYYGTSAKMIADHMQSGSDVILEIDWQGAQQVKKLFPEAVGIFILPPSIAALEERLTMRALDEPAVIRRRIQAASEEIAHARECEYVIINQSFAKALAELMAIITAARCRFNQQAVQNGPVFEALGISPKAG